MGKVILQNVTPGVSSDLRIRRNHASGLRTHEYKYCPEAENASVKTFA